MLERSRTLAGRPGALIVALAGSVVTGCARGSASEPIVPTPISRVAPPGADDDLREIVMRELIDTFGAMEWSPAPGEVAARVNVLCLGFEENVDPSAAFMGRFRDEHRVVQASRCRYDDDGGVVRAQPSGLPATFLFVERVRRVGSRAEAIGSYFHDGKAAREDRFVLELRDGRWFVISRTTISIS